MDEQAGKTHWHRLLGKLFELLFATLPVTVNVDFKLMSDPPRADILLLRRETAHWTASQRARLPDGVRDTTANHILLEFKYTESLNSWRLGKAFAYDILYRIVQGLSDEAVSSFILSSRTPQHSFLDEYGYQPTAWSGVYQSHYPFVKRVTLLVLNELSDEPHNAYVKCFASRRKPKKSAFDVLKTVGGERLSNEFWQFISGLSRLMLPHQEEDMLQLEITPEDIMNLGKGVREGLLSTFSAEERLVGLKPEERLVGLKPEDVLSQYKPEDVLSQYKPEVVLSQYEPYLEEREQQAEYKTMLKTVRRTLRIRFKLPDEQLDKVENQLRNVDLFALEGLSETALLVEAWADFDAKLQAILPPDKPSETSEPHRT